MKGETPYYCNADGSIKDGYTKYKGLWIQIYHCSGFNKPCKMSIGERCEYFPCLDVGKVTEHVYFPCWQPEELVPVRSLAGVFAVE